MRYLVNPLPPLPPPPPPPCCPRSVAINGTCLTVVAQSGAVLRFDVIGETLARTNLGLLQVGGAIG